MSLTTQYLRPLVFNFLFEKLTNAPGTNAFPWINLYPISNAIAYSYSLDSDFLLFNV